MLGIDWFLWFVGLLSAGARWPVDEMVEDGLSCHHSHHANALTSPPFPVSLDDKSYDADSNDRGDDEAREFYKNCRCVALSTLITIFLDIA